MFWKRLGNHRNGANIYIMTAETYDEGKIGIVGVGFVGAAAAFAVVMRGVAREIVLCDLNRARAEAEAMDISHAVPFANPTLVRAGDYSDFAGARVVVITAGVSQKPGESRLELLERNAAVFRRVIPEVLVHAPNANILIATNPVDIMTHLSARLALDAGGQPGRVFGSGTTLDTARFRSLLAARLAVDAQHVHAQVLGEHGDSEVLVWSRVTVGGMPLDDFLQRRGLTLDTTDRAEIEQGVRRAAYTIIEAKGATYYGIGSAIARIVEALIRNQLAILTLTAPTKNVCGIEDVSVALPRLVGSSGILDTFLPSLASDEQEALRASAVIVREAISALGL